MSGQSSPCCAARADDAETKLRRSLELDDRYDLTYFYLGNLLMNQGETSQDQAQKTDMLTKAADYLQLLLERYADQLGVRQGARLPLRQVSRPLGRRHRRLQCRWLLPYPSRRTVNRITNATQKQQYDAGADQHPPEPGHHLCPGGQIDQALAHAQVALSLAPNDNNLKNLVEQLKQQQKK